MNLTITAIISLNTVSQFCLFNADLIYREVGIALQKIIGHILCVGVLSVSVPSTETLFLTNVKKFPHLK